MNNQIHKDAQAFRSKKIKEVFSKDKPSEIELEIITKWAEIYGNSI